MAKALASTALLLVLNLLFFTLVSANYGPCSPPEPKNKKHPKHCPRNTLKLGACATVLGGLGQVVVGGPPKTPCCTILDGLLDLEAAVCLCSAIKANILGFNLNFPISFSFVLDYCGKKAPSGFDCS